MKATSTRGKAPAVAIAQAIAAGLAPDGGLYMPETLPRSTEQDDLQEMPPPLIVP